MSGMAGKLALVTGASSGIGRATALKLANAGADVALVALPGPELTATAAECEEFGAAALAIEADVGDSGAVDHAFALVEELGSVDAVFGCAGTSMVVPLTETSDEQWASQLRTNLTGSFFVARAAARLMIPRGRGTIVLVASELALMGQVGYVAYTATKGGILSMTRALAAELAPHGVRVNALCPGTVDTPLLAAEFEGAGDPLAEREQTTRSIATGRIAHVDEIAAVALFLLSDESSYVTGSHFVVDGGRTGCYPAPAMALPEPRGQR
jgi:NAD(P)-dependent dehydrogenase (short-subunit alcohol dehydrogenase family)